jgi:hypothetical protein
MPVIRGSKSTPVTEETVKRMLSDLQQLPGVFT